MRLGTIHASATFTWSPLPSRGGLLAVGSVAGALGDNFDAESTLEIHSLSLNSGDVLPKVGSIRTNDRFNRLTWGFSSSETTQEYQHGLIAGGLVDGTVQIWNPKSILESNDQEAEVATITQHKGHVRGVEFNPFNQPLLATAGQDGEWYVWNLINASQPQQLPVGSKATHPSEIVQICWNRKVQHILGWTSSDGVTCVWDLKSKRQAMTFQNRLRCSTLAWSPEKATDVCVAVDDDANPCIQFWDLRKAYSPCRVLTGGHNQGILSLSWSPMDSNLLLSCGKDMKTICWNPNTAEILCQLPASNNWVFDVQWSPRIPALLATASYGENISVHSLQDSSPLDNSPRNDEFGSARSPAKPCLKTAPKWLRRPAGASFGFGGRLVTFGQPTPPANPTDPPAKYTFQVSNVVTEPELVQRANHFEEVLKEGNLANFCQQKVSSDQSGIWKIMQTLLHEQPRKKMLEYLGFGPDQPGADQKFNGGDDSAFFDNEPPSPDVDIPNLIKRSLIIGDFESAVNYSLQSGRMDDALVLASYGGPELWKKTQEAYFRKKSGDPLMKTLSAVVNNKQLSSLVEEFDSSSETEWKEVMAMLCTYCPPEDFLTLAGKVGERLSNSVNPSSTLAYMAAGDLDQTVQAWASAPQGSLLEGLQELIEKVSIFQRLTNQSTASVQLADKYSEYALLLVSQGCLQGACRYLELLRTQTENHKPSAVLRDRVFHAQGISGEAPPFPFNKVDVYAPNTQAPAAAPAPAPTPAPHTNHQPPHQQPPNWQNQTPYQQPFGANTGPGPAHSTNPYNPNPNPNPNPNVPSNPSYPHQPPHPNFPNPSQPVQPPAPSNPYQPPQPTNPHVQPPNPYQPPQPTHPQPPNPYSTPQPPNYPNNFPPTPNPPTPTPAPAPSPYNTYTHPNPNPVINPNQPPYSPSDNSQGFPSNYNQPAPPKPAPVPPYTPPLNNPPVNPTPPPYNPSLPAGVAKPQPVFPAPGPAAAAAAPAGGVPLTSVNTSNVDPQWQPMITNYTNAFNQLSVNPADARKKVPVERALVALFSKLNSNEISADVCQLLLRFSQVCESNPAESKEIIRKLTDQHWEQYKAFKDIKFLHK